MTTSNQVGFGDILGHFGLAGALTGCGEEQPKTRSYWRKFLKHEMQAAQELGQVKDKD